MINKRVFEEKTEESLRNLKENRRKRIKEALGEDYPEIELLTNSLDIRIEDIERLKNCPHHLVEQILL